MRSILFLFAPLLCAFPVLSAPWEEVTAARYPDADAVLVEAAEDYAYKPDGTYVEGDYPYLTYNDLYYLREYLTGVNRTETDTLTYLMGEKLQWMEKNGVTGYEKG
ncbi:MAG TPA: hypothetical protein DDY72_00535 [Verrucomicrobia bacterium]|nr:hypothetical protein [Verrucomicrobiota bacterium]